MAVSLNFLYTLTSALLTTFGVYWLGREGAGRFFDVACLYSLVYIVQSGATVGVLLFTIDLMYKRKRSPVCHTLWVMLVPAVQTADHVAFWYISYSTFLASRGSEKHRNTLYQPLFGGPRLGPVEDLPELASKGERIAVVVSGTVLHVLWCLSSWYFWLLIYKHGSQIRWLKRRKRISEERHLQQRKSGSGPTKHEFDHKKKPELIGIL